MSQAVRQESQRDANDDSRWERVLQRRAGDFVYAVKSTGIACVPQCPSRRPKRANVEFFPSLPEALAAGYRPCLRCRPDQRDRRLERVAAACRLLSGDDAPAVAVVAEHLAVSPAHLGREMRAVLGVTPGAFARRLRVERGRRALAGSGSVLEAAFRAGFGSASPFYAALKRELGMPPAKARAGGPGEAVSCAVLETTLGLALVGWTGSGVCDVSLGDDAPTLVAALRSRLPRAEVVPVEAPRWATELVAVMDAPRRSPELPLDLQGTAFQERVWRGLRAIPPGETRTYGELAASLGLPRGARAVAGACAANRIAVLVPCHRVVRGDGGLGGYRWGLERKEALLDRESG
ncbi:MAG: bifunctional DNA-binding transcriptional regulator/O6-methylguanine-DNA methyltransferase Ada [Myxococcota bacterium]